jgi:hypothetical protein
VLLLASTFEAQTCLASGSHDALEQAQRALASARSVQLTGAAAQLPQLVLFTQLLDLLCSLIEPNPQQARAKMQELVPLLEQMVLEKSAWAHDEVIFVPIASGQNQGNSDCTGAVSFNNERGVEQLALSWIPKRHISMLSAFLHGIIATHMNAPDSNQAEKCFEEALSMAQVNTTGT